MKNKRILALLLAFVMVFTALPTSLLAAANPPTLNEALTAESDFEFDEATGTIKKYNGTDTDVVIPSKIGGVDVKEIGKSAFSKKNLTSVTIPEGVEIIDQGAFIGNLITELSLPSTVKRIEKVSFATNTKLSKVVFNEGLEYIGQGAFVNDAALTGDITIPSTVKTVMTSAFNKSGVTGIILKGDKDSSPVNLHSKLNGNSLEYVKSDDPYKSIKINFNTLGTSEADKYLELGEVKFKAETKEKLQAWLDENINVQFVANYVNLNDRTGESDKEITLEKVWDLDKFDLSNKFEVTANVNKDLYSEIEEIPGYSKPCISCSHTNLMIRLVINPVEEPATEYVAEDFTYDGASITGFSETGLKKFETLKEVNLPEKSVDGEVITAIGKSAFREKGIEKVTIPETVTLIDDFAFNSNKLTEIKLPSKLEKAGMSAFGNNTIAEVTIPGTLKEIPNGMFSTNLSTKIVIEEGVETIGASAFIGCKVESLEIPASVKEIGRMAFKGGSTAQSGTLKELILHEGLEKIGKDAFQNESLKEVNIPRSLKEIDNTSFRGNGQVVQLKTSNKAHLDFNNEKSLKNQEFILVEEAVTEYVAEDFTYDGASITGFSETGLKKFATLKEVNLPEKSVEGEVITAIGKSAFRGKGIEKVTIPETVTLIDDFAFNSNKLTEIKLPSKLEKAGMSAFGLNSIEEVTIPGTLKEIPNGMFSTNLSTKIVIEEGVETIGVSAFTGCKIERLEIPASVKIVGKTAFSGGSTPQSGPLKELILHEGLEVIEKGAFQKNNLKEVKMPSSLKEIGDTAFFGNGQVVILNTENYEHVRFNNDKSLKNQKFVFKGTVEPGTIEEIPEIKKEDIEKEVVQKGEEIDLTDNIKNLPAGSTVKDITEPMIDTNVVGDYTGKVEVTFSNGSKRIVEVAIVVIDKTELQNLVDKAKKIDLSNKTEESKKALEEAIKEAEEVLENATSQEEIDKAKEALQKAIDGLEEKPVELNKTELQKLVDSAKKIDLTNKTEESKKALEDAIKKAEEALENATSQEEIDKAKEALEKAIKGLKEKPQTPGEVPGTDPIPGEKPGTKPDPKPEVKPEPKPEVKPEKNIFDGIEKERQAGDNRYKTAVEISKKNFESAETVILVNGEKEADALAASVLAKEKNAPILLIKKDMTPDEVAKEIERLGAKNIILIGGLNSVTQKAVENLKLDLNRIAGKDRFETAVEIAKAAGKTEKLILANGQSLVDALTASSLAQVENRGIILVNKDSIPECAKELVEKAKDILIVGGENSVKLGVKADRISGKDRFETAVKIAERAFVNPKQIALANSTAYADALVFGGVTGKVEAPILLTNKDKLPQVVKEYLERNKIEKIFVLGGENSVSENLFK